MAYNKYNVSLDDDTEKAKFNEAAFIMRRLNNLQDEMNLLRSNLTSFNEEKNDYNYKIFLNHTCSLFNEVWSKLSPEEKEEGERLRTLLKNVINNNMIHKVISVKGKKQIRLDNVVWPIFENVLYTFERNIKCYLNNHGMGNPTEDDEGL